MPNWNMRPETRREARLAFTQALDKLIEAGAPITPSASNVLEMWWMSGIQWGIDHVWMEHDDQDNH